jgi:hypothetical protein
LPTMDADVTFATLSSCRTINVRTKYVLRVHWLTFLTL